MEIGPIPAMRVVPTAKVLKGGPRFSELLDIENAPEPMKDTLTHGEDQSAPGRNSESETEDQPDVEDAEHQNSGSSVDLFA